MMSLVCDARLEYKIVSATAPTAIAIRSFFISSFFLFCGAFANVRRLIFDEKHWLDTGTFKNLPAITPFANFDDGRHRNAASFQTGSVGSTQLRSIKDCRIRPLLVKRDQCGSDPLPRMQASSL
jgi:hypothetical protein